MAFEDKLSPHFEAALKNMTLEEKVSLLHGKGLWRTRANYRHDIPDVVMTDGTYGVRYAVKQIDHDLEFTLEDFLAIVNQDQSSSLENPDIHPATCFPTGSALGCSWDVDLAYRMGGALAEECHAFGVHLLLGPGINLRRTPLAGRSYEYYAEDPVLSGEIGAAVVNGLQDLGVGACVKHFACNNSEMERTTMNSVVDERTLREVYLSGFERVVRKANPVAIMTSYNRLNGPQAAEHPWLLTTVLREEWGYNGLVVSDWHAIKDRPASLLAGNDLDMPYAADREADLLAAARAGVVSEIALDRACRNLLLMVQRLRQPLGDRDTSGNFEAHHTLARHIAAESIVLLKRGNAVPITAQGKRRVVVVGPGAMQPILQGSGSATTRPTRVDIPLHEIIAAAPDLDVQYAPGCDLDGASPDKLAEAVALAADADTVIVFVNTLVGPDGENSDRTSLDLAPGHDALIARLAELGKPVIVVCASPDAVLMPWIDQVDTVLATFFAGQGMGHAIAAVLTGAINPSGKLTTTFPRRIEDTPAFLTYPGEQNEHLYAERIFAGHRYFDRRGIEPLFPFGFGLSFTDFAYSALELDGPASADTTTPIEGRFTIANVGQIRGKETWQLYLGFPEATVQRADRALTAFGKVELEPGEQQVIAFRIDPRDLAFYDVQRSTWRCDSSPVRISIGSSSRDICLTCDLPVEAETPTELLTVHSQPWKILNDRYAGQCLGDFLKQRLGLTDPQTEELLLAMRESFLGIFATLGWMGGGDIQRDEIQALLDRINLRDAAPAGRP
jgi:beta-glucosidase